MEKNFCTHCGANHKTTDIKCQYCGNFTIRFRESVNKKIEVEENSLTARVLSSLLLAIVIIICVILISNSPSAKDSTAMSFSIIALLSIPIWAIWFLVKLYGIFNSRNIIKRLKSNKINKNDYNYVIYDLGDIVEELREYMRCNYEIDNTPNITEDEIKKAYKQRHFLSVIISLSIAFAIAIFLPPISESISKSIEQPSMFTKSLKEKPEITGTTSLSGVEIIVITEEDYEEVHVIVELYDKYGNLALTETLIGKNYKKDRTYNLRLQLPLTDALKYKKLDYEVGYYK